MNMGRITIDGVCHVPLPKQNTMRMDPSMP